MTPIASIPNCRRQVGDLLVRLDVGGDSLVEEADIARIDIVARMLERDGSGEAAVVEERPADLRIAKPCHPWRPPIFEAVGGDVAVHEQGVRLAREERTPASV